jgi:hypothetical protein
MLKFVILCKSLDTGIGRVWRNDSERIRFESN